MTTPPCLPAEHYTVGWVCALPVERAVAALMLDEKCCRYAVAPVPGGGAGAWKSYRCLERVTVTHGDSWIPKNEYISPS